MNADLEIIEVGVFISFYLIKEILSLLSGAVSEVLSIRPVLIKSELDTREPIEISRFSSVASCSDLSESGAAGIEKTNLVAIPTGF